MHYCARPSFSQERLGRLNEQTLVYSLRRSASDGRTEPLQTRLELLDLLAQLVTPPRLHKHLYCGVLAPSAELSLVRIYERLPLRCRKCGEPMRIFALVLCRPQVKRILKHIGDPEQPPMVPPAFSNPAKYSARRRLSLGAGLGHLPASSCLSASSRSLTPASV